MKTTKEWRVEDYRQRLIPDLSPIRSSFRKYASNSPKPKRLTTELLEDCYRYMAFIVNEYGEHYLPIFERLDSELKSMKRREELLSKARLMAEKNNSHKPIR